MNPKVILNLLMSAGVGTVLTIGSATAATLSEPSESTRQSAIQVDVVDLEGRDASEQLIAGNSSSNSSNNSSSNNSSNSNSNSNSNNNSGDDDD